MVVNSYSNVIFHHTHGSDGFVTHQGLTSTSIQSTGSKNITNLNVFTSQILKSTMFLLSNYSFLYLILSREA